MATPRPWRLPRGRPRRVRTPKPAPLPIASPPSSRRPSLAPIAFQTIVVGGRAISVSSAVLARFEMAELIEALLQHGPLRTRAHQTKHRFRSGTLTVLSNASQGDVFIVNPTELRLLAPPKRPR